MNNGRIKENLLNVSISSESDEVKVLGSKFYKNTSKINLMNVNNLNNKRNFDILNEKNDVFFKDPILIKFLNKTLVNNQSINKNNNRTNLKNNKSSNKYFEDKINNNSNLNIIPKHYKTAKFFNSVNSSNDFFNNNKKIQILSPLRNSSK